MKIPFKIIILLALISGALIGAALLEGYEICGYIGVACGSIILVNELKEVIRGISSESNRFD